MGSSAGVAGQTTFNFQAGWTTIYIPVIKNFGSTAGVRLTVQFYRDDGTSIDIGYMDLDEFADSGVEPINVGQDGQIIWENQDVYMAGIIPCVVNFDLPRNNVKVRVIRNLGGTQLHIGRPILIGGTCSWYTV